MVVIKDFAPQRPALSDSTDGSAEKVKRKPLNFQKCVKFPIGKFSRFPANSVACRAPQHRVPMVQSQSLATLTIACLGISATMGESRRFPSPGSSHSHGLGRKVDLASACDLSQRHDGGFALVRRSRISDMRLERSIFCSSLEDL